MTVAVLDTAVLYPVGLADTLLRVAAAGLYQPVWSRDILVELRRTVLQDVPDARIDKRIADMNRAFPESLTTGYEALIPTLTNDPGDRHVLAAAITAQASLIVTANLSDFPTVACSQFGIEAVHPDAFLCDQLGRDPDAVVGALRRQASVKKNPPVTFVELLEHLAKSVPKFVDAVAAGGVPVDPPT